MQTKLYASNYQQRREETFNRAGGRCENILANGQRCTIKLGQWRITHSKQLQFEQLIIHHPDGDPENPDARMLAVCWACHMRLHRQPGPGRPKASARKQGYEVIRISYLLDLLARAGLHTWSTADGRVGWQIGILASVANDSLDALAMALHWMTGEIADLQHKLNQLQENPTMLVHISEPLAQEREQDPTIRLQHAEQCHVSHQPIHSTMQALQERKGDLCGEHDEQERRRQLDIEIRTCQASERRLADAALREMRCRPLIGGVRYA